MKIEVESKILVGAESKVFLSDLTKLVERMEKAAGSKKDISDVQDDDIEEEKEIESKVKKAATTFDDDDTNEETEIEAEALDDSEEEKPKKAAKAKSLTLDDVNDAAMSLAGRTNRANVLGLMKKHFKIKSVTELDPSDYAAFIKLMK